MGTRGYSDSGDTIRRNYFTVDPFKGMHIADGSARAQPEKDDFVAKGVQGKRDRGFGNRESSRGSRSR